MSCGSGRSGLVLDAKADPVSSKAACARIGNQLGITRRRCAVGWPGRRSTPALGPARRPIRQPGSRSWNARTVNCAGHLLTEHPGVFVQVSTPLVGMVPSGSKTVDRAC